MCSICPRSRPVKLVLELSDYCVQDIAQTVRSTLEPLAADKKLAFKVEIRADLPPGRGDGRRLTQVLINLVGNAIKFTDTGEVAMPAARSNNDVPHRSAECPLLAHSGHFAIEFQCPLLGVKRTLVGGAAMSAFDPKRTSIPETRSY